MKERPNSRRNLDLAIERLADSRDEGLRLRRIFANTIVAQMMPHGAVKGGSAMRIRFGYAATRFSTDLDTARAEDIDAFISDFANTLEDDFWNAALSEDKVSSRFMRDSDATIETVDGKDVVVIRMPWVDRYTRPVFIDGNLFGGTFRRTHTGDQQCKREEVLSMLRDSDTSSADAAIAENGRREFINDETVQRYRRRFNERNENHVWANVDDDAFLTNIGALRRDEGGELRPTRAGLLMFGEDRWITYEFPHYFLDYRQETGHDTRWEDRFTSQPGDWTGNVYDFYFRVYNKLKAALKVAFGPDRTTLTLPLTYASGASADEEPSKTVEDALTDAQKAAVEYLGSNGPSRTAEASDAIGMGTSQTNVLLHQLVDLGYVAVSGATSARRYRVVR